jgi:hypothetical protein
MPRGFLISYPLWIFALPARQDGRLNFPGVGLIFPLPIRLLFA